MRFLSRISVRIGLSLIVLLGLAAALFLFVVPGARSASAHNAVDTGTTFQGTHGTLSSSHPLPDAVQGLLNGSQAPRREASTRTTAPNHLFGHHSRNAPGANLPGIQDIGTDVQSVNARTRAGEVLQNFAGLNSVDSQQINTFVNEPPDQGLCVGSVRGNKVVVEIINAVVAFYNPSGSLLGDKLGLNTFFGEPSTQFLTDPRCVFDTSTQTFFFTVLAIDTTTGSTNHVDLLVLRNNFTGEVVPVDVTFPDNKQGQCPCLGDQPKLGIDAFNIYITIDEFDSTQTIETGDTLIALSKGQLFTNAPQINTATFLNLALGGTGVVALEPAITTGPALQEFLLNSFLYSDAAQTQPITSTNQLGLWSLSHPERVTGGGVPDLSETNITSQTYGFPVPALTTNGKALATYTNDDRVQQVQYNNGHLVAVLNSAVTINGDSATRDGAAWFEIQPVVNFDGRIAAGRVTNQGDVAAKGEYVIYPSIEQTFTGSIGIAFSVTSPTLNPSTGYAVRRFGSGQFSPIRITKMGSDPDIGVTCSLGAPQECRWGDYSWTALDPNGRDIWMGAEDTVPQVATSPSGAKTNWGTQLWEVQGGL